jgi:hypothetical protein
MGFDGEARERLLYQLERLERLETALAALVIENGILRDALGLSRPQTAADLFAVNQLGAKPGLKATPREAHEWARSFDRMHSQPLPSEVTKWGPEAS